MTAVQSDKQHFLQLLRGAAEAAGVQQVRQLFLRWQLQQLRDKEQQQESRVRFQIRLLGAALGAQQQLQVQRQLAELQQRQREQLQVQWQLAEQRQHEQLQVGGRRRVLRRRRMRRATPGDRYHYLSYPCDSSSSCCSAPGQGGSVEYCYYCSYEFSEGCQPSPFPCLPNGENYALESSKDCLLRRIRLGLHNSSSSPEVEITSNHARLEMRNTSSLCSESDCGYIADDEASIFSEVSSEDSTSLSKERHQLILEVRSLVNISLVPRYGQIWKPFRCFKCGGTNHLAHFCQYKTASFKSIFQQF